MTLEEIKKSSAPWILPEDVANILGCDPQNLRKQIYKDPESLGFPVSKVGTRLKIWRIPFLKYIGEWEGRPYDPERDI